MVYRIGISTHTITEKAVEYRKKAFLCEVMRVTSESVDV